MQGTAKDILPWPINALVGLWRHLGTKNGMQTTGEYLDHHFKSSELKALLASQWADYGLPPSESAFALHALVVRSYFQGGWFPDKGAGRIARTFEVGVEANGGSIKVCQEVTHILTEGLRVVGVKALDGQRPEPIQVEYRAPIVISDAGAIVTCKLIVRDRIFFVGDFGDSGLYFKMHRFLISRYQTLLEEVTD